MNQAVLDHSPMSAAQPPLNQGQQEAADAFFQFLFSEEKEFGISGPGGVGKTFLMGHLIDVILPRYFETCKLMGIKPEYDSVHMTATTNKAAEALAHATKRSCETAASFFNLKVQDDFSTGKSKLIKTRQWVVHTRKIIFIDECSMIDSGLYAAIQEGTMGCKIVYVGDHCQLAPVGEKLSPVYMQGIRFYNLTEPMRNAGQPELIKLCNQLRNTVETGVFQPIKLIPGVIDWADDEQMEEAIAYKFTQQTHDSRILAYTNKRVIQYNDHIRTLRQLPDHYTVGEFLVNNTPVHLHRSMLSVEAEVEIVSLDDDVEDIVIEPDTILQVRRATIRTAIGSTFTNVPIPIDRDHFTALVKHYQRTKNWERYFHLKGTYPDLRPQDASTVYKAQGSTYDIVFIDLGNISACNVPDQVARMLYVAISRPRTRIIFYGNLAEKYGGLTY